MGLRNLFARSPRGTSLPYAPKGRFRESEPGGVTVVPYVPCKPHTILTRRGIFEKIFPEKIKIAKQLYLADIRRMIYAASSISLWPIRATVALNFVYARIIELARREIFFKKKFSWNFYYPSLWRDALIQTRLII